MAKMKLPNGFAMNIDVHAGLVPMDTVFMHGNLSSNNWWQPSLELWTKKAQPSYEGRLIFAEWRGCGQSDAPTSEDQLQPANMADDYILALQELGVKKACIVAHSTGGLIALSAMLKAPELFDRAVFLDPVSAKGVQFEKPMYDAFTQMSQDRAFCAMVMSGTIYGNDDASPLFQTLVDDAHGVAKLVWHGVPNVLSKFDISQDLSRISHPVLVLHGEFDMLLPIDGSIEMAQALPNGRFTELKGQGHSSNVENPALFVQTVDQFLFTRS